VNPSAVGAGGVRAAGEERVGLGILGLSPVLA
jgi:hypothetical protein